jgi:hypothetical protein
MNYDDLVKRLRNRSWGSNITDTLSRWADAREDAAQALTALQSQVAALTAELEAVRGNALEEAAKVADAEERQERDIAVANAPMGQTRYITATAGANVSRRIAAYIRALASQVKP